MMVLMLTHWSCLDFAYSDEGSSPVKVWAALLDNLCMLFSSKENLPSQQREYLQRSLLKLLDPTIPCQEYLTMLHQQEMKNVSWKAVKHFQYQ